MGREMCVEEQAGADDQSSAPMNMGHAGLNALLVAMLGCFYLLTLTLSRAPRPFLPLRIASHIVYAVAHSSRYACTFHLYTGMTPLGVCLPSEAPSLKRTHSENHIWFSHGPSALWVALR